MKDLAGNIIYQCPNCLLEYTVPPAVHEHGGVNLHCGEEACKCAILEPKPEVVWAVGDGIREPAEMLAQETPY